MKLPHLLIRMSKVSMKKVTPLLLLPSTTTPQSTPVSPKLPPIAPLPLTRRLTMQSASFYRSRLSVCGSSNRSRRAASKTAATTLPRTSCPLRAPTLAGISVGASYTGGASPDLGFFASFTYPSDRLDIYPSYDWTGFPSFYLEMRQEHPYITFITDPLVQQRFAWSSDAWPTHS